MTINDRWTLLLILILSDNPKEITKVYKMLTDRRGTYVAGIANLVLKERKQKEVL